MENENTKVSGMEVEKQYTGRPVRHIVTVASMATGISFVWALQLSLLTPYVQLLGIPHTWAAFIWLCGPISGILVQPVVGYYSDRCTSRHGRRRPFIAVGVALISLAVFIIGYAADMGRRLGDPHGGKASKPRAIVIFVVGFWVLDVANNMVQGPCRAFLGDLSENNQARTRIANGFFSLFMAVGNILGYAAGSFKHLHYMFPFTVTRACDVYCANLKTCFFLAILLLLTLSLLAVLTVPEEQFCPPKPASSGEEVGPVPFFGEIWGALRSLPRPMWILLMVSSLNWIGFFPFLLYDTDWMGREVYGGKVGEGKMYDTGVRAGSLALMLNSVVLALTSLLMQVLSARGVGVGGGGKRIWGFANLFLSVCMAMTVLITKLAESSRRYPAVGGSGVDPLRPTTGVLVGAFALFAVMGVPFSLISIIPYALASIYSATSNTGQGLSMGVLNLSICIPQMIVSVLSGPWDALFGGGNLPAFVVGAIAAAASGVLAFTVLPSPPPETRPAGKDSSVSTS